MSLSQITRAQKVVTVTSLTLVNATAKNQDYTVPAGERWIIKSVKATNCDDVARATYIFHYLEAACTNLIGQYAGSNLGAGSTVYFPNSFASAEWLNTDPAIVDAGETIRVRFESGGASTGATDADGIVISYLKIFMP